ncbi:hypothetical protein D3C75_1074930 [compost metagenome]
MERLPTLTWSRAFFFEDVFMVPMPKLSMDWRMDCRFSSESKSSSRMLDTLVFAWAFSWVSSSGSGLTSS